MDRKIVDELYERMTTLTAEEQHRVLRDCDSDVKAELWKKHLQKWLDTHDLSEEQRAILSEGIRLITTPSWFEIIPGSPEWDEKNNQMKQHKQRALMVFTPDEVFRIFYTLGGISPEIPKHLSF